MPSASAPTIVKLRLLAKMTMLMMSSWTIIDVPRMTVTYTCATALSAQDRVAVVGLLLRVTHADHSDDGTQHNAQHQCNGRDQQGRAHALDVLLPAVRVEKCLVNFTKKSCPKFSFWPFLTSSSASNCASIRNTTFLSV